MRQKKLGIAMTLFTLQKYSSHREHESPPPPKVSDQHISPACLPPGAEASFQAARSWQASQVALAGTKVPGMAL